MIFNKSTYFKVFTLLVLSLLLPVSSIAQEETVNLESDTLRLHSVSKATWKSAMVPSWGQAYNKKYWKMPLVYAAMGTTVFLAIDNHRSYRRYLDAFNTRIDDDPNTSDEFIGIYDERQLIEIQDQFRKWRDLNIILTGFAYALQIIDAHVDAHLFYYDVSDDLSFRWEPSLIQTPNTNAIGVSIKLDLK